MDIETKVFVKKKEDKPLNQPLKEGERLQRSLKKDMEKDFEISNDDIE